MASRIDFAVHAIPVAAVAAGENIATETIARDTGKILTGTGTIAVTFTNTLGYTTGTPSYLTVTSGGWTAITVTVSKKFMFIRHTGFTSSAFTTATTSDLRLRVLDSETNDVVEIMRFPPKAGVVIPLVQPEVYGTVWSVMSTSGNICVEYFVTD